MKRVCILGTSGCGKTTLGRKLAEQLGAVPIDLDELFWKPGWVESEPEEFLRRLAEAMQAPCWVISGNYSKAQEKYLAQADTVVWLDYSRPVVMWRIISRSLRRCLTHESCCNGNYETLRKTFTRDSVILWAWNTYGKRKRRYNELFQQTQWAQLTIHRFQRPREAEEWLESLRHTGDGPKDDG